MKTHFLQLFDYNRWANDLFTEVLGKQQYQHEKIEVFYSHIAAAQLIWLSRIQPSDQRVPGVWELISFEEASRLLSDGNEQLLELIKSTEDFDREIHYANSKGHTFTTLLAGILTHVANHGTHHRGQIALLLREEGLKPPASDFIFYLRS